MNAPINDGGPAFPVPGLQAHDEFNGMSLRDYFAAKAMQGLIANVPPGDSSWAEADLWAPTVAYLVADAMLEARSA